MDYNPLDQQHTYKNCTSNPEIIRKIKSEESIVDQNRLAIFSSEQSFVKSNNSNGNLNTVIDDKYRDIYNTNLRKSIESISSGKGYEPVYKNYRYQPQFKPLTAWASTQRHLTLPDSRSNLSLSTMSSYKSFSSNTEIYDNKDFRLSNNSQHDEDFATTKTDSIEFKPRISKLYCKTTLPIETSKTIIVNRDSMDYELIVQNQGLIANQLQSMFSTMKKNEDEPESPELKSFKRRSVTINEGKNTEFMVPDDSDNNIYATIDKQTVDKTSHDDVITSYQPHKGIEQEAMETAYSDTNATNSNQHQPQIDDKFMNTMPQEDMEFKKHEEPKKLNESNSISKNLSWNWKKKSLKKKENVVINLDKVDKFLTSNIPKFLVTCVKSLHDKHLLKMQGIYRSSPGYEVLKTVMKSAIYDHKYTDIENCTDGILLSGLVKSFFKNLSTPLLTSNVIDEKLDDEDFKDKLIVNDLESDMIEQFTAIVDSLDATAKDIFLFFIMHLKAVERFKNVNHMDYPNLARLLSPCLFYSKEVTNNFDMFILSSNQSMLLQVIFENYKIIFDSELLDKIAAVYDCFLNSEQDSSTITDLIHPTSSTVDENTVINEISKNNAPNTSSTRFSLNFLKPKSNSKKKAPPPPATKVQVLGDNGDDLNQSSEDLLKESFCFIRNKKINIETVAKQNGSNIPELIFTIVQTLTIQKLNGNELIYQNNMNNEEMKAFIEMVKRHNDDELKRFNNGCQLAFFLKEYVKLFDPPLLNKPLPELLIYQQMTNDIAKVNIEFKKYSEYVTWIEPHAAKETFMFLIKHLNDVSILEEQNKMTPLALAKIWSQCFFGVHNSPDQTNQIKFLEYSINNYKKMFGTEDTNVINNYFYKAFYDPMNLPLPVDETKHQCCSIS